MTKMESILKEGELFCKEVIARLKGDDDAALASKITRKAISSIKGQISALESKLVDDENLLEEAQEKFLSALYPTQLFTDSKSYTQGIVKAEKVVSDRQEELEQTKDSIEFFKELLKTKF